MSRSALNTPRLILMFFTIVAYILVGDAHQGKDEQRMESTPRPKIEVVNIPDFWLRVHSSKTRLLALDYDGTLAPFHVEIMKAYPLPGIRDLLAEISDSEDTRLAIISGRPLQELEMFLGGLEITMIGSHGYEIKKAKGDIIAARPSSIQITGLAKAAERAARTGFNHKLEVKVASVALHTRGMDPAVASDLERQLLRDWSVLSSSHDLECRKFNGGVEIRSLGINKGDSILALVEEQPRGSLNIYVGDDDTDEDAFCKLSEYGLGVGIKVGNPEDPTAASGFLTGCEEVRSFLETWCWITSSKHTREGLWQQKGW